MKSNNNPRRLSCHRRTARQVLSISLLISAFVAGVISPAQANGIQTSTFFVGLMNFLNDLMTVLTIACPVVGGLAALVFTTRRSMADEQDGKMWNKRIYTAIICGVAGCLISGVIALITGYFVPAETA